MCILEISLKVLFRWRWLSNHLIGSNCMIHAIRILWYSIFFLLWQHFSDFFLLYSWMQIIFVPDYNVSVAEVLIPASELSQHIRCLFSCSLSSKMNAFLK